MITLVIRSTISDIVLNYIVTRVTKEKGKAGDFVLVVGAGNAQHVAKRHKASTTWQGPYEIVAMRNVTTLGVRKVGSTDQPRFVHWTKVKRFCGADVNLPVDVTEQAQRAAPQFEVDKLKGLRAEDGNVEVLVSWKGFPSTYDTWESAKEVYQDVGRVFVQYLKSEMKDNEVMKKLYQKLNTTKRKRSKG